ncbi:hypothetical protein C2S51_018273 [Perilla frutescens var. frutescens]|nr:hypothetical protein C2S51_018273 [Perilla frutescens var. frutescens]
MGRKNSVVSFLCGVLFRRKPPAVEDDGDEPEVYLDCSTGGGGGGVPSPPPDDAAAKPCSPPEALPPPPGNGNFHMRTFSCGHSMQHRRSNSGVSKLVSSLSLRVMGGGGGAGREEKPRHKERMKYFKHEDSVWKKTIILGERCRVPDDGDDDINLFDEKGNKISTYHPKSYSGLLQYSRQNTGLDQRQQDS